MDINSFVKPSDLIDIGVPSGIFWNVDKNKDIKVDIFIVASLAKGYNLDIVEKFSDYFGDEVICEAFRMHQNRVSDKLIGFIEEFTKLKIRK